MHSINRLLVYTMYLNIFLVMISVAVLYPLLSDVQTEFDISYAAVSWTVTAFGLARLITNLPAGYATGRLPRIPLLLAGTGLVAAGSLISASSTSLALFLLGRAAAGVGSGICTTAGLTSVLDASGANNRGRATAIYHSSLAAGAVAGPGVGGLVGSMADWRVALFVASIAAGVSIILLVVAGVAIRKKQSNPLSQHEQTKEPVEDTAASTDEPVDAWHTFNWRIVSAALFAAFAIFAMRGGIHQTLLPLMGRDAVGLSAIGVSITLMMMTGIGSSLGPFAGVLSDKIGRVRILLPAIVLSGIGAAILVSSTSAYIFIIGATVMGIAAAANSLPSTMVGDALVGTRRANAIGSYRFTGDIALTLAPVATGWLIDHAGFGVAGYVMAGAMLVTAVLIGWTSYERPAQVKQAYKHGD